MTTSDNGFVETDRDDHRGKAFAYVAVLNPYSAEARTARHGRKAGGIGGEAILGIAVLGEAGYSPLDPDRCTGTFAEVSAEADRLNALLGWEDRTAQAIIADTMHRSKIKNEIGQESIVVSAEERNTILAALRFWQREGNLSSLPEWDIATDGSTNDCLGDGEIDALCERINVE